MVFINLQQLPSGYDIFVLRRADADLRGLPASTWCNEHGLTLCVCLLSVTVQLPLLDCDDLWNNSGFLSPQ
jgi:hypothetical protein